MANVQRCHLAATGSACPGKAYAWLNRLEPVVDCLGAATLPVSIFAMGVLT